MTAISTPAVAALPRSGWDEWEFHVDTPENSETSLRTRDPVPKVAGTSPESSLAPPPRLIPLESGTPEGSGREQEPATENIPQQDNSPGENAAPGEVDVSNRGKEPAEPIENSDSASASSKGKEPAEPLESGSGKSDLSDKGGEPAESLENDPNRADVSEKAKGPADPPGDDLDDRREDDAQWMRYPSPPALRSGTDDLPETVLDIVRSSVAIVEARVEAAERQRLDEEKRQRAAGEEAEAGEGSSKGKGKEKEIDYFPIIIPEAPEPPEVPEVQEARYRRRREEMLANQQVSSWSHKSKPSTGSTTSKDGEKTHKRHKYNISRLFNRLGGGDKGESSSGMSALQMGIAGSSTVAAGALLDRDALLKQLGAGSVRNAPRKSADRSSAGSADALLSRDFLGRDARLKQLGAVAALLQRNNEQPAFRPSVVGSVRRQRTKGSVKKNVVAPKRVEEGNEDEGQNQVKIENPSEPVTEPEQTAAQSDDDSSTEHEECVSCLDEFLPETMVKVPCHYYCRDCFTRLVANALQNEQQWPPKCCLNEIPFRTIYACIETDLRNTFQSRAREWSTPIGDRVYCHEPDCSVWLSPDLIDAARRVATCARNHATCAICRGAAHDGSDCPDDPDLNRTNELAEAEGWKRCARCRALVEHGEACQHMTCRCGYEFCYVCVRQWRTCSCTMAQLAAVKAEAVRRRTERVAREAAEETELQEALRRIENLEIQEALAAVERSLEVERRDALRRRGEIAARFGDEEARRTGVAERFLAYRRAMADLNDRQREAMARDAGEEAAELGRERAAGLEREREAERAELAELEARVASRIEGLKAEFAAEFAERMEIERAAAEEYFSRLRVYWSGMKNEEAEINRAISQFRAGLDAQRAAWTTWRDREVESAEFAAAEERGIREEVLAVRRGRAAEAYREREVEAGRKRRAGPRWLEAVVEERERLLREREGEEMGNGLSFAVYDPVEVAIVREMLDNGEEIEVVWGGREGEGEVEENGEENGEVNGEENGEGNGEGSAEGARRSEATLRVPGSWEGEAGSGPPSVRSSRASLPGQAV
ncbi:uncharacterized protein DNG_01303 [Cephalotrichum gorgonifer]|uniref:RBR-type E3 ubiquitin transferase n=1 Tax=Cephalotrichum gorgonifer TaxID=2041049 RepID=A0AAE8MRG5_9PEZI|nr:uncharacterized protein DNG_01303 [Cephalotrichum gorgonifer]